MRRALVMLVIASASVMPLARTLILLLCVGAALALTHRKIVRNHRVRKIPHIDPDCSTILMGKKTVNAIFLRPKVIVDTVNVIEIPNPGRELVGVQVEVCNQWRNGRPIILAPVTGFSPLQVYSGAEEPWGETEMVVRVTQYLTQYSGQPMQHGKFVPADENDIFDDDDLYRPHGKVMLDI